jgi:predicted Rossmann-fold nucleotide-binding protein
VLIQTSKIRHFPVVLVRSSYWAGLTDWIRERLVADGMIAPSDLDLFTVTDDPDEVVARVRAGARRQGIQLAA